MGKIAAIWRIPSPQPSPQGRERIAADFAVAGSLKNNLDLQPLISGRLKSKKQSAQPIFLAKPLIPTAAPSSLPWERVRERATNRKVCIGAVRVLGKVAAIWRMPSPQPSPTGEGVDCSGFCGYRQFEKQLGFTPLISGRLKNKKQSAQPVFLAKPLIPTAAPSSLPWERVRERATSRKACIEAIRELGEGCRNSRNALSPALPHGGGGGLQQIQALQVV